MSCRYDKTPIGDLILREPLSHYTKFQQNAITTIRTNGKLSDKEVAAVISTGRAEDKATPLHIAAHYGHTDVIRSLLVCLSCNYFDHLMHI
jgi:ankyrin repeat protein